MTAAPIRWDSVHCFRAPRAGRTLDMSGNGKITSTDIGEYTNHYFAMQYEGECPR